MALPLENGTKNKKTFLAENSWIDNFQIYMNTRSQKGKSATLGPKESRKHNWSFLFLHPQQLISHTPFEKKWDLYKITRTKTKSRDNREYLQGNYQSSKIHTQQALENVNCERVSDFCQTHSGYFRCSFNVKNSKMLLVTIWKNASYCYRKPKKNN